MQKTNTGGATNSARCLRWVLSEYLSSQYRLTLNRDYSCRYRKVQNMFIVYIMTIYDQDPLWLVVALSLLPAMALEMVFLVLAGIILRASAVWAGKGWILRTLFFVLGIVLECGITQLLRQILPFKDHIFDNWLLGIVIALLLVGIISFALFHLMEWIETLKTNKLLSGEKINNLRAR